MGFICDKCHSNFTRKENLNKHIQKNSCHGKQYNYEFHITKTTTEKISIKLKNNEIKTILEPIIPEVNIDNVTKPESISEPITSGVNSKSLSEHDILMQLLKNQEEMRKEIQQLKEDKQALINITNTTINNNYINIVFNANDGSTDIANKLRESGMRVSEINQIALNCLDPKNKLKWTLDDRIIDLSKQRFPLDYRDGKFWMIISKDGDMIETTPITINKINNSIMDNFVAKSNNLAINSYLEEEDKQNCNDYDDKRLSYSELDEDPTIPYEIREKNAYEIRKKASADYVNKMDREWELVDQEQLIFNPRNGNIHDKRKKFVDAKMTDKYIRDVISEAKTVTQLSF